jgi:predicted amidophosphoribosyltransferase
VICPTCNSPVEKPGYCKECKKRYNYRYYRRNKFPSPYGEQEKAFPSKDKKYSAIAELRVKGQTLQFIGDIYGLTRERIRQILKNGGYGENSKLCPSCEKQIPVEFFDSQGKYCKSCRSKISLKWQQANKYKANSYKRNWEKRDKNEEG